MQKIPDNLNKNTVEKMLKKADKVKENAYSIKSNTKVGAALLTQKNNIYTGTYVESVIEGLGTCAERNAIGTAISNGEYQYKAIAITSTQDKPIMPCGACRQTLAELNQVNTKQDIKVITKGQNQETQVYKLEKLLPDTYGPKTSGRNLQKYRKNRK